MHAKVIEFYSVNGDFGEFSKLHKFTQHQELKKRLLATGTARLVEHTENDSYWGDGGDGSGKNMLGKILMDVRQRLSTH